MAPFGSPQKCDFGGLSILGNILGGISDIATTVYTNDTNESIARRTNQTNKEINESQLAWARENYELEKAENRYLVDQAYERELENREYNSPSATKQRWIDAGFNPSLMMSPSQLGSIGSVGSSVGSNPHHNNPSMIPAQNGAPAVAPDLGLYFSRMADSFIKERQEDRADSALNADIQFRQQDLFMKSLKSYAEIDDLNASTEYKKTLKDKMRADMLYERDVYKWRQRAEMWNSFLTEYQAQESFTRAQLNQQAISLNIDANNRAWQMLTGQLSLMSAQAYSAKMQGELFKQESSESFSREMLNDAEWWKRQFNNSHLAEMYENNKKMFNLMLIDAGYEASMRGFKDLYNLLVGWIPFAPGMPKGKASFGNFWNLPD